MGKALLLLACLAWFGACRPLHDISRQFRTRCHEQHHGELACNSSGCFCVKPGSVLE